jgi:hypothetical protein
MSPFDVYSPEKVTAPECIFLWDVGLGALSRFFDQASAADASPSADAGG